MHLAAAERQVAITFDDLPRSGDGGSRALPDVRALTERLLRPFREQKIPVIGFVNERPTVTLGSDGVRQILNLWLDYGADLGSHSYSHLDINDIGIEEYTEDILKGEILLRPALASRGKSLRYYRHPFLHTGPNQVVKRQLKNFL